MRRRPGVGLVAAALATAVLPAPAGAGGSAIAWTASGGFGPGAPAVLRNVEPVSPGGGLRLARLDSLAPSGGAITVVDGVEVFEAPALAAAAGAEEYLLVWRGAVEGRGHDIHSVVLDDRGRPLGPVRAVSAGAAAEILPRAAPAPGGYLVVWEDGRRGRHAIFARRLDGGGRPAGPEFAVSPADQPQGSPDVAWSDGSREHLVAWLEGAGESAVVVARRVGAAGPVGSVIEASAGGIPRGAPRAAAAAAGGWLVLWTDHGAWNADVRARRLDAAALPDGPAYPLRKSPFDEVLAGLAAGPRDRGFVYTWDDYRRLEPEPRSMIAFLSRRPATGSSVDVLAARLDHEGLPRGGEIALAREPGSQQFAAPAWSRAGARYVAAWQDGREGRSQVGVWASEITPGGVSTERRCTEGPGRRIFPQTACAGLGCLVVWSELPGGGSSGFSARPLKVVPGASGTVTLRRDAGPGAPLGWSASWEAETPAGARVSLRARRGPSEAALEGVAWGPALSAPGPLSAAGQGRWVELEVLLESLDGASSPILREVALSPLGAGFPPVP